MRYHDLFGAETAVPCAAGTVHAFDLTELERRGLGGISRLPYSIRVMLESLLRHAGGGQVSEEQVARLAAWQPAPGEIEVPLKVSRVVLQDFTGVPAVVDLAAMRSAVARLGGDPERINPQVPVDLVVDHSVQVDYFGTGYALSRNVAREHERNRERYMLLKWAQSSIEGTRVVPPGTGIVHQVNLEHLARVVMTAVDDDAKVYAYPDSVLGTDSHTVMINGLGVLGWGVGGIEAEAVMLGEPYYMLAPEVVGMKLTGSLREGTTATDLVLTVTQLLREHGVVGKLVEYTGEGAASLPLADRATLANMAPEYGATMGYFPPDAETMRYLRQTGRDEQHTDLVERVLRATGLFREEGGEEPAFSSLLELDLSTVLPSLAGPKRPQDLVALSDLPSSFRGALEQPVVKRGFGLAPEAVGASARFERGGEPIELRHGSVTIAAITSCTNTSNPSVMVGAGLLARKAVEAGLRTRPWVKTSLAPGSKVVTRYLEQAGLMPFLEALRFHVVGYGCTTCIGNSGPLPIEIEDAIDEHGLVVASVLSGNRNFEGRIHPKVRASYLASPMLVVAYALAGRMDLDFDNEPIGHDPNGEPVFLREIWPSPAEISDLVATSLSSDSFRAEYGNAFEGDEIWQAMEAPASALFSWDGESTYVREPPFFADVGDEPAPITDIAGARALLMLGDSTTTDHISPAGAIAEDGPAGRYLREHGIERRDFNSFGSRRGNHEVMMRGTFANVRIRNLMLDGVEGGFTLKLPEAEQVSVFDAAAAYREEGVPLVVLAGHQYGMGSSRDWAAKGTALLGVRAVVADSFERIHRSNLVGMGVLPLQSREGSSWRDHGLTGRERFDIRGLEDGLEPGKELTLVVHREDSSTLELPVICRADIAEEVESLRNGGILQSVLRRMLSL